MTAKYLKTKEQRIKLIETIEEDTDQCNDIIDKENGLLIKIKNKDHVINLLNTQNEKRQSSSTECMNIINAYKQVIADSEEEDAIFLHYSGHGTKIRDDDHNEESDGFDEAL